MNHVSSTRMQSGLHSKAEFGLVCPHGHCVRHTVFVCTPQYVHLDVVQIWFAVWSVEKVGNQYTRG